MIFVPLVFIIIILVISIILNTVSQDLIYKIQKDKDLFEKAGRPTSEYFLWDIHQCRYSFAKFILLNKSINNIDYKQSEYSRIRVLLILFFCIEIFFGILYIVYCILLDLNFFD